MAPPMTCRDLVVLAARTISDCADQAIDAVTSDALAWFPTGLTFALLVVIAPGMVAGAVTAVVVAKVIVAHAEHTPEDPD